MTFKTCGFLYGGISRVNDDGTPRRSVFDSIRDETKVKSTLNTITSVKSAAVNTERHMPKLPAAKNMVIILAYNQKTIYNMRIIIKYRTNIYAHNLEEL